MKHAFVTLLLMLATATQPLLATPVSCSMPAAAQAVACPGCCAKMACCVRTGRAPSEPIVAVVTFNANMLPVVISTSVTTPPLAARALPRWDSARNFLRAHAPPPLAQNCIQLI
ncbi:MAG: hypothetical protein ABI992_11070 [Chthoniobacterales bacterium]